jgi:replicative DNA helicase
MSQLNNHVPSLARPAAEVVDLTMAEVELRHEYPDLGGLRTGIEAFDKHAREAMMPGSLIVVGGESGKGKTAFMVQLAVAFSGQTPALLFTLEDKAVNTVKRALSNVSQLNVGRIRAGFSGESGIPQGLHDAADVLRSLDLDFIDGVELSVEMIAQQIWAWKRERKVTTGGVVLIDQLSHIVRSRAEDLEYFKSKNLPVPPSGNAQETAVLEWQVYVLKLVAQRLGVTIVLAHQLNEVHAEGAKPTVRSIRSSRGILHKADLVVIPWRPDAVPNPFASPGASMTVPNSSGYARLLCVKAREVDIFDEEIRWVGSEQRFVDVGAEGVPFKPIPAPSARTLEGEKRLLELRAKGEAMKNARLAAATVRPALAAARDEHDEFNEMPYDTYTDTEEIHRG